MNKMITATYYIHDCENYGDIQRAECWLTSINNSISILDRYWDRHDCGIAYIKFKFPSELFVKIYQRVDADYDEDINDYIVHKSLIRHAHVLSKDDFHNLQKTYNETFTDKKITLLLFFEQNNSISDETIIQKAITAIGVRNTTIEGICYQLVDRRKYVNVLFNTDYENIDINNIQEFGNYCLGRKGWLHDNHIYGELIVNTLFGRNYQKYWEKIRNKEALPYSDGSYYSSIINIPYDEYMDANNKIKVNILHNGKEIYPYIK